MNEHPDIAVFLSESTTRTLTRDAIGEINLTEKPFTCLITNDLGEVLDSLSEDLNAPQMLFLDSIQGNTTSRDGEHDLAEITARLKEERPSLRIIIYGVDAELLAESLTHDAVIDKMEDDSRKLFIEAVEGFIAETAGASSH